MSGELIDHTLDAVFAGLNVAAVTALGPVFSNVPAKQQPPFVEIGAIDAEDYGGSDTALERHTVELEFQYRGSTRKPLLAQMKAARTAMTNAVLADAGATFGRARWLASATDRDDDGVTWHGIQKYELLVQPAD